MKIEITPRVVEADDYHEFYQYSYDNFMQLGFNMRYEEIEPSRESICGFYRAITWPEGAEDELFEFIFTNKQAWEALTIETE